MKIKIAIFASGSGTNAENIAQYFAHNEKIEISLIISNKCDAYVLERAKKLGIKSVIIASSQMKDEDFVLSLLKDNNINFIVLAGYLLKIPSYLISHFPNAIVNIHPALLPKFGGKGMYGDNVHKAVVEAKEKESGITVHFVNENYDEGTTIFQAKCPVLPTDTFEDVASKVHKLEYAHFPHAIESVCLKMI
ncbi:MAG: phosphoribosylglycinamide formyltransferase [Bacteroidales bacterium]|nr:phosphoribosylglycinamide formyltransferase [Bacteroidales bacterium]